MDQIIMLDDDDEEQVLAEAVEPQFLWEEEEIINMMGEPMALKIEPTISTAAVEETTPEGVTGEHRKGEWVEPAKQAPCPGAPANELLSKGLQRAVASVSLKVEELQRQVMQVARTRSTLKRSHSEYDKDLECTGYHMKQHVLDAECPDVAKRRKSTEVVRLFANVLRQLMQHKWAWPFLRPVDVKGLHLHDYYKVIRRPMDLGTIRARMEAKDGTGYRHVREMCEDVRLVFRNAMLYNESWTDVYKMAKTLSYKFEAKWRNLIEPKLIEEEEKYCDAQLEGLMLEIEELRSAEVQAAKEFSEEVLTKLSHAEQQLEVFLCKLLTKCRTLSLEEKRELSVKFCDLSPAVLNRAMEMITSSQMSDHGGDDVQINLEAFDSPTLWRLQFFIKMVMNAKDEQMGRDKVKRPREESSGIKSEENLLGSSHG